MIAVDSDQTAKTRRIVQDLDGLLCYEMPHLQKEMFLILLPFGGARFMRESLTTC